MARSPGFPLLLAVVALVAAACTTDPGAGTGRLVVTGPAGEVLLVDPADGHTEELAGPSLHPGPVQPTASRDGTVVVWSEVSSAGPVVAVWDGEARREIPVPTLPFFYAFSPGGDLVAALGNHPDGAGVALVIVDLDGATGSILDAGQPYYLDWDPLLDRLAVHVGADDLSLLEVDGARTALDVRPGSFQAPAWTVDARLVALRQGATRLTASLAPVAQAVAGELVLVEPANRRVRPIAPVAGSAAFDVARARVAYVDDGQSLRVVGIDGSDLEVVTEQPVVSFEWSPDASKLLFHVLEGTLVPHVWDGESVTAYPGYTPTATLLTEYLPFWSQYTRTITQWSPDSTAFAYPAMEADGATVWVQPLDGERRAVATGEMVSWTP